MTHSSANARGITGALASTTGHAPPGAARPLRSLELADLAALSRVVREAGQGALLFDAVHRLAQEVIGCRLFTIMRFDASRFEVERLFSNRHDVYPLGGRKKKAGSAWGDQVLTRHQPFLGKDRDAIRTHFDDHDTLFAMGLGSILNIPVAYDGQCVGTMNLTHEEGWYDAGKMAAGLTIAAYLAAPLMASARSDSGRASG